MCAIIDANIAHEAFGKNPPPAGTGFRRWVEGKGRLVWGGKLRKELARNRAFAEWARNAVLSGKLLSEHDDRVDERTEEVERQHAYESDDPHILALAQISGARLLYSNDRPLHRDFKNSALLDPPGTIYTTLRNKAFGAVRRRGLDGYRCPPSGTQG